MPVVRGGTVLPVVHSVNMYVVRLYSWYDSYRMVTEARSPLLKADNLNHVAVDS